MNVNMAICMGCGVPAGKGKNFCPACGSPTNEEAVMCVNCGVGLVPPVPTEQKGTKSRVVAGILAIFFGSLGVHNFYINRKKRAIAQLALTSLLVLGFIFVFVAALVDISLGGTEILPIVAILWILLGFGCFIASCIWSFVEAILLLCGATATDGQGKLFKD